MAVHRAGPSKIQYLTTGPHTIALIFWIVLWMASFTPRDTRVFDSVPGYKAQAYWSLWDPLGKHANQYGELTLVLHLGFPVGMRVGTPRGLNVERPRTSLQMDFALAADMSQASRHPLVPRAFPWPYPNTIDGQRIRPSQKLVRTPILHDIHMRSGRVYERQRPATRRKRLQRTSSA